MISEQKKQIDLSDVIRAAGVELKQRGSRHVGLCPFHIEKTPSFFVFVEDQKFKCFGCGISGDSIDFIQKMYGLSFQGALKHLGIEQGPVTSKARSDIRKRKRRAELVKRFRKWELHYCIYISDLHFRTKKLMMSGIPPEDLDLYAMLFHKLPTWEHHISILISGDDKAKFKLYKDKETHENFRFRNAT